MFKKTTLLLLLILLPLVAMPAASEIYLDQEPPADWSSRDVLRLTAFATYENDCILMEVGGRSMLIDGGVSKWRFKLREALTEMGYGDRVDVIFNTHPHDDHLECVFFMLRKGYMADEFWSAFAKTFGNILLQQTVAVLDRSGIPYRQLSEYETVDFGGATLVFFWWDANEGVNARSVLMHITFGESTVLMTADAEGKAQWHLLNDVPPELLKADILKYPHHGIRPARADFMDAVDPAFAFVSSRRADIPFTVNQLEKRGIAARYVTAGRIVMATDGKDWYIKQYKGIF